MHLALGGLGSAMLGWILALGGYAEGAIAQNSGAIMSIEALFIYIPVAITVLQVLIMIFYKLDKEYDSVVKDLNEGRGELVYD